MGGHSRSGEGEFLGEEKAEQEQIEPGRVVGSAAAALYPNPIAT